MAGNDKDNPRQRDMARAIEDAEDRLHGRLDDADTPLETGPIERGAVDAGPTGEREGGYRQAESGSRIAFVVGIVIAVIVVALLVLYLQ